MPTIEARNYKKTLYRTVLFPVFVIFVTTLFLTILVANLFKVIELAEHSSAVISQARTCEKLTIDLETSLRGYIISSFNPTFLDSYNQANLEIGPAYEKLSILTGDNPTQQKIVRQITLDKNVWLDAANKGVEVFKNRPNHSLKLNPEEVKPVLERKKIMDNIRSQFKQLTENERILGQQRVKNVNFIKRGLTMGGAGLGLLTAFFISFYVWRQLRKLNEEHRESLQNTIQRTDELAFQKEWLHVTLSSIGDAVLATDWKGRITFLNAEAEKILGSTLLQASGMPVAELMQVKQSSAKKILQNPIDEVLKNQQSFMLAEDAQLVTRTGIEIPIQSSASPIFDKKNHLLGVVLVFRNVTNERNAQNALVNYSKKLEDEVLKRTESLSLALMEMEAFSYSVSHDLRSPLRAMEGYAAALLEDEGERLTDNGRNYLTRIQASAARLDQLIHDLLTYTRVSKNDTPLVSVNLDLLVRDMVEQYPNLQRPKAHITVKGHLPYVLGSESALTQVFSNLLGNAVKFVPPGVTPTIVVRAEPKGKKVRIWVEDNGIGIDAINHDRIFHIFERVDTFKLYSGTGIGLAITKKAVESMGGRIGLESSLGLASRFWFEINKYENI
jgi:PAS domain S-box-containing protein